MIEQESNIDSSYEAVLQDLNIRIRDTEGVDHETVEQWKTRLDQNLRTPIAQAGAAGTQEEYEAAYDEVFEELDQLNVELETKTYLLGNEITQADVRLYSILVRFDIIYYFAFRLNRSQVKDFKNLWRYARELYHRPEFQSVTDFQKLKEDYYQAQTDIENPYHLIANGPDVSAWEI
jgi:putative glutathione S-transferase